MPSALSPQPNSFPNAHHLELESKLPLLNIKRGMVYAKPNGANILLNNARLGSAFFHHVHAYAVHIVNVCPAKNVIDQDGNPTTPYQYSSNASPALQTSVYLSVPPFSNVINQLFATNILPTNSNFNAPLAASSLDSLTIPQAG